MSASPAPHRGRSGGGIRALLPVFARTRGSWWTGVATAVAAAVIVVLHAVTQGLTLSPAQQVEGYFGGFDHALTNVAEFPLGSGPDMAAAVPTGVTRLVDGEAPSSPGDVCFSPALARQVGDARELRYYGGALELTATCTAVDDQHRDGVVVYAAPGTWAAAGSGLPVEAVHRWGVSRV